MISILYIIVSLLVIYVFFSQRLLTSASMFMLGAWFFITTPSFIIALNNGYVEYGYSIYSFSTHDEASLYSIVAVALIIPFSIASSRIASQEDRQEDIKGSRLLLTILVFFIPVIIMYVLSGQIPIISFITDLLQGDGGRLNDYRSANISYLTGEGQYFGQGYFSDWALNIFTFIVALALFDKKISRNRLYLYLFLVFFANAAGGRRWPMFISILYLAVTYMRINKINPLGVLKNKIITGIGTGVFILGFIISISQGRFILYGDLLATLPIALKEYLLRFSIVSGIAYSTAIEYFGSSEPFRWGQTYGNDLLRLLQFPMKVIFNLDIDSKIPFSVEFYAIQNLGQQGFTASPTLLGSFYVNFGLFGIIVGACIFSTIFLFVDAFLSKYPTVEFQVLYAFICVLAFTINTGDLLTFVVYISEFIIAVVLINISQLFNSIKTQRLKSKRQVS